MDITEDQSPLEIVDEGNTEAPVEVIPVSTQDGYVFDHLTPDLVLCIFGFLEIPDLIRLQLVSRQWNTFARNDGLWSHLYENTEWSLSPPTVETENTSCYDLYRLHYEKELAHLDGDGLNCMIGDHPALVLPECNELTTTKLRQLLENEEFVMALQNGEDAVLTFLETPATIQVMMKLLFNEPHRPDDMPSQRIIHITIQTLVSGFITDVFIVTPDLLDALFDHLDELNVTEEGTQARTNFIAKIISILFEKFTTQMIGYFQTRDSFVPTLLSHTQDPNLMEILYKFADSDITHQWLFESDLLTRLVALLHRDESLETQDNATNVLVNILSLCQAWPQSVLINDMLNNEVITGSIVAFIESKPVNGESIKLGLRVLIGILSLISDDLEDPPIVVSLLANSIHLFASILSDPADVDNAEPFETTATTIKRGFGFVRLGVLELLVSLLYTGFPVVVSFMLEENVFTIILDLLFEYPWNNIIHNQISQMFSGLFCCNNAEIIQAVMENSRLPERIAEAHKFTEERPVGYLGHLRELANELVRVAKMSESISDYLSTKAVWQEFLDEELKEFNLIECVVQDDYLDYENQYFQEQYDEYEIVESEDFGHDAPYDEYRVEELGEPRVQDEF